MIIGFIPSRLESKEYFKTSFKNKWFTNNNSHNEKSYAFKKT